MNYRLILLCVGMLVLLLTPGPCKGEDTIQHYEQTWPDQYDIWILSPPSNSSVFNGSEFVFTVHSNVNATITGWGLTYYVKADRMQQFRVRVSNYNETVKLETMDGRVIGTWLVRVRPTPQSQASGNVKTTATKVIQKVTEYAMSETLVMGFAAGMVGVLIAFSLVHKTKMIILLGPPMLVVFVIAATLEILIGYNYGTDWEYFEPFTIAMILMVAGGFIGTILGRFTMEMIHIEWWDYENQILYEFSMVPYYIEGKLAWGYQTWAKFIDRWWRNKHDLVEKLHDTGGSVRDEIKYIPDKGGWRSKKMLFVTSIQFVPDKKTSVMNPATGKMEEKFEPSKVVLDMAPATPPSEVTISNLQIIKEKKDEQPVLFDLTDAIELTVKRRQPKKGQEPPKPEQTKQEENQRKAGTASEKAIGKAVELVKRGKKKLRGAIDKTKAALSRTPPVMTAPREIEFEEVTETVTGIKRIVATKPMVPCSAKEHFFSCEAIVIDAHARIVHCKGYLDLREKYWSEMEHNTEVTQGMHLIRSEDYRFKMDQLQEIIIGQSGVSLLTQEELVQGINSAAEEMKKAEKEAFAQIAKIEEQSNGPSKTEERGSE